MTRTTHRNRPPIPVTQPGDMWLLGPHRIICGDCRDYGTVERLLAGERVNVAFTSPPYASQRAYDESSGFKPIPPGEYVDWFEDVQASVRAVLAEDGSWFVNIKEHAHEGQRDLYVKDLTIAHVRRWGWLFVDELCWVDAATACPAAGRTASRTHGSPSSTSRLRARSSSTRSPTRHASRTCRLDSAATIARVDDRLRLLG